MRIKPVQWKEDRDKSSFGQQAFTIFDEKIRKLAPKKGSNMLFHIEKGNFCLLKYEGHNFWVTDGGPYKGVKRRASVNVRGSHRLSFEWDEEFGIWLVSSEDQNLFLHLEWESLDGKIETFQPLRMMDSPEMVEIILARLIKRPNYFEKVIVPFLRGRPTQFHIPSRSLFKSKACSPRSEKERLLSSFEKATAHLVQGDFVYVGCKEEVYLLTLAKDDDGRPYMQGTYTTSAKPILFFSNGYLGYYSIYDVEKITRMRDGRWVVDLPSFPDPSGEMKLFVFPIIQRYQNCKNTIFMGEPELITGDKKEALAHFATTDFAEFADVVEKYADSHNMVSPFNYAVERRVICSGRYFF